MFMFEQIDKILNNGLIGLTAFIALLIVLANCNTFKNGDREYFAQIFIRLSRMVVFLISAVIVFVILAQLAFHKYSGTWYPGTEYLSLSINNLCSEFISLMALAIVYVNFDGSYRYMRSISFLDNLLRTSTANRIAFTVVAFFTYWSFSFHGGNLIYQFGLATLFLVFAIGILLNTGKYPAFLNFLLMVVMLITIALGSYIVPLKVDSNNWYTASNGNSFTKWSNGASGYIFAHDQEYWYVLSNKNQLVKVPTTEYLTTIIKINSAK